MCIISHLRNEDMCPQVRQFLVSYARAWVCRVMYVIQITRILSFIYTLTINNPVLSCY